MQAILLITCGISIDRFLISNRHRDSLEPKQPHSLAPNTGYGTPIDYPAVNNPVSNIPATTCDGGGVGAVVIPAIREHAHERKSDTTNSNTRN